jgi:DNA-binding beta-propeller fold protein YncE
MHDIRFNEVDDEIIVPSPFADAILVFKGGANGQEAPIRILQGPHTQIGGSRLAIDTKNREIFVPGADGGIVVLPLDGNGDVTPKRVLRGPDTQLGGGSLSVDPLNNVLVASGQGDSILIFDRMASGNTKPLRVIKGPKTQIDRINQLQVYPEGKLIVLAMPGIQGDVEPPRVFVGMWSIDDNGDVPPKWTINGNQTGLYKPFAVALNPEHKELYVTDMRLNGVFTFSAPEIFVPAR